MNCWYLEEIIKYHESGLSLEKKQEIEKHLETCQECRDFLEMLSFSKDFICKEPDPRVDFYSRISSKIDSERYKEKKINFKILKMFERIKPVFKPVAGVAAVLVLAIFLKNFGKLYLENINDKKNTVLPISILHAEGSIIVTKDGQEVTLKGIHLNNNVWGNWVDGVSDKLRQQGEDANVRPLVQDSWVLEDEDFQRIKELGCNYVSYGINYQLFENSNPNKIKNIEKLKKDIKKFADMNIYTVVALVIAPGLDTERDYYDAYKPGSKRLKTVFEDEAVYSEWQDMWAYLAEELKDVKGLAGYGLINRPRVPCDAEGGLDAFREKMNKICETIRGIDEQHIIFVPEYASREVNQGETYYDANSNLKIDAGEQGISWETGLERVDVSNIAYTFEFFEPIQFANNGNGSYDASSMEVSLKRRVDWINGNGNCPLVAVYGVSRANAVESRVAWIKTAHKLFDEYGVYPVFYEYKTNIGAYINCEKGFYALFGEYVKWQEEIVPRVGTFDYVREEVRKVSDSNGFSKLVGKYYINGESVIPVSSLDNELIIKLLKEYWR